MKKRYEGFSLIEILVVVALIIILATITIVAINPAKNFKDTRDAQRSSDVNAILNAVTQFTSQDGNTPAAFGTIAACDTEDWKAGTSIWDGKGTQPTGSANLQGLVTGDFIVSIPKDPSEKTEGVSGYVICTTPTGRVQIAAPGVEGANKEIAVKR